MRRGIWLFLLCALVVLIAVPTMSAAKVVEVNFWHHEAPSHRVAGFPESNRRLYEAKPRHQGDATCRAVGRCRNEGSLVGLRRQSA